MISFPNLGFAIRQIIVFGCLFILLTPDVSGQPETPYLIRSDEDVPAWVRLMYKENADPGEVMRLYKAYYRDHPFVKNQHTQYYKRWISGLGKRIVPDPVYDPLYLSQIEVQNQNRSMDMWSPIGPFDWDHDAAGKSYAPGSAHVYTVEQANSNPNILFAGTANAGVWKSIDHGLNWTACTKGLLTASVTALEIHPTNPSIVYAEILANIYKSTNGGTTWQPTGNLAFQNLSMSVRDIRCHPDEPHRVFAATNLGFYRSVDSGINWINILAGDMQEVEFHPSNPDTIYVVQKDGMRTRFYRSLDGGNTMVQFTAGWPTPNTGAGEHQERTEIAVTPDAPNNIYALATGSAQGGSGLYGVYKSTNLGVNWTFICCGPGPGGAPSASNPNLMGWSDQGLDDGGQYYYDLAFAVSPYNKDSMWVCGVNLWVSGNEGASFVCPSAWSHSNKPNYVHADIHDLTYVENTGELWLSGDGGIFYSSDRGANFHRRNVGIMGTDFWGFGQGHWYGDVMLGGAYHNGTMLKEENVYLNGWICTDGGDGVGGYVNPGYDRQVYSWFNLKEMKSNRTINPETRDYYHQPNSTYITGASSDILFHPNYYGTWYTGSDTKLLKTNDNGFTFEEVYDFGVDVASMDLCVSHPNVIYACTFPGWWDIKRIYRSDNSGESWTEITPPEAILNHPNDDWVPYDIVVSPDDPMEVWIARTSMYNAYPSINGYTVYKSTNGGSSWTNISGTHLNGEYPTSMIYQRGTNDGIYIGTRRAVFYKSNTMANWTLYNSGLPARLHSTRLATWYRAGKLRNATDQSVWEAPFFEAGAPVAIPAVQKDFFFCHRDTAFFVDLSALRDVNATWSWSFPGGNPATSNIRNPKVVYNTPGIYDVTLIVQDANGVDSATIEGMITVDNKCKVDTIPGGALKQYSYPDFVKIEDLNLTTQNFTLSAWVKPTGIQNEYTGIFMNDGNAAGLNFREGNNTLAYHWPGGAWWWDSNLTLPVDQWSYVAMVVKPGSVTLYVNGFSATHATAVEPVTFDNVRIGSYQGWESRNFIGEIDEVCIWNRALTTDEIRLLRHLTKSPSGDPTIKGYYQFDENITSGFITDKANGHDGILNFNAAIVSSDAPVGSGTSQLKTITTSGLSSFANGGDVDILFGATHPNGQVVVSHLLVEPDTVPELLVPQNGYYIINNYGSNQAFTGVTSMTFKNCGTVSNYMASSMSFKLLKRVPNGTGLNWQQTGGASQTPTAGLNTSITLTGLSGITTSSQFIITREEVPSGHADVAITAPNEPDPLIPGGESASFLVYASKQGLKLPVLNPSEIQSLGIPAEGQIAFLEDSLAIIYFNGVQWVKIDSEPFLQTTTAEAPTNSISVSIPQGPSGDSYMLNLSDGLVRLPLYSSSLLLTVEKPVQGMLVYDTTLDKLRIFNKNQWVSLTGTSTLLPVSANAPGIVTGMAINQDHKHPSSVLELHAGGKALIMPVLHQGLIYDPVQGLICFNPYLNCIMLYDGQNWNIVK